MSKEEIIELTPEEYNEVRKLLVVAIGVMEEMRKRYHKEDAESKGDE